MFVDKIFSFFDIPSLQGTKEQIALAELIRKRLLLDLIEEITSRHNIYLNKDEDYSELLDLIRDRSISESNIFGDLIRQDWAVWWIENRFSTAQFFLSQ